MICVLRHSRNGKVYDQWEIEKLFERVDYNTLIVVPTQKEEDYLTAMCIVMGRELQIVRKVLHPYRDSHLHVTIPFL